MDWWMLTNNGKHFLLRLSDRNTPDGVTIEIEIALKLANKNEL